MVGRGLRNAPGKNNCLVLDFAGNIRRHGPIDAVVIRPPGSGDGEAPVKECGDCHSLVHASVRVCPDCGALFPVNEDAKHKASADVAPVLSRAPPTFTTVIDRTFNRHEKTGKPTSVRAEYRVAATVHREWLCPGHDGYAKKKADRWWVQHHGRTPCPASAEEWIDRGDEPHETSEISVRPSGQYWEICQYKVGGQAAIRQDVDDVAMTFGLDDDIPF